MPLMQRGLVVAGAIGLTLFPLSAQTPVSPNSAIIAVPTPPPAPSLQSQSFTVYPDYKEGNAVANLLRNSPAKLYTFDRASLRDVLRFLADDSGIPFVALQEKTNSGDGPSVDNILVTFTMRASPFLVLESIAKANGVSLIYENGVWFLRPYDEKELIGRTYKLRYTPQENVVFQNEGGSGGQQAATSSSSQSGQMSVPNVTLQQSQLIFKVEEPGIVKEIKNMLKIPTKGVMGRLAADGSVGNFPEIPGQGINPSGAQLTQTAAAELASEPTVTFNSDANALYIVATRQQHQWVEGFLTTVDQPQALIGIEVKFFETTKDPSKELGINWAGTLRPDPLNPGYEVALSGLTASTGATVEMTSQNQAGQALTPNFDYTTYNATVNTIPYSAVLTAADVRARIMAFMSDKQVSVVQYPRVLTINNREVAISNARNEPTVGGSSSTSAGGGSTTTSQIQYLPIGTQINILPKTMPDNSVVLTVAITVSSIIDFVNITQNGITSAYPRTSSRIYNAALQVDSGYTLAVGGLEEARDTRDDNGIPLLKDIPVAGYLFKSKARTRNKRNLIIFITPTIIKSRSNTGGISETPETVIPLRPNEPTSPAFTVTGRLVGGEAGLHEAFLWLERQLDFYRQINKENRTDRESLKNLRSVINTANMVLDEIQLLQKEHPGRLTQLIESEQTARGIIKDLNDALSKGKKNQM